MTFPPPNLLKDTFDMRLLYPNIKEIDAVEKGYHDFL
jgi:hypothetical protein